MQFESVKKWWPLLGLTVVVWLCFYVAFWIDRVGCGDVKMGACLYGALGNWLGDAVMLGWVRQYQTLLGGAAAIVAGYVVYSTSRAERADVIADRKDELRTSRLNALGALRMALLDLAGFLVEFGVEASALPPQTQRVKLAAAGVTNFAPELAHQIAVTAAYVERLYPIILNLESRKDRGEEMEELRQIVTFSLMFLSQPKRLLDDESNFVWKRIKRDSRADKLRAQALQIVQAYFEERG